MSDALHSLKTETLILQRKHPGELFEHMIQQVSDKSILDEVIVRWLTYVGKYRARGKTYSDDEVVTKLSSVRTDKELVALFDSIRTDSRMHDFANGLQIALTVAKPDVVKDVMIPTWASEKVLPEDVFQRLPISKARERLRDVGEEVKGPIDPKDLEQWLEYVDAYIKMGNRYDNDDLIMKLSFEISWDELPALFYSLRSLDGMTARADALQAWLVVAKPSILKPMFKIWLKANVLPEDAYHMMPVAVGEQSRDQQYSPADWPTVSDGLVDWLDYVDMYSAKFAAYPDNAVFELLMKERTTAELVNFFGSLRWASGMQERAEKWQTSLNLKLLEGVRKKLDTCLEENVTLDVAHNRFSGAAWIQSSESISDEEKKVIEQLEELWLQYVERYTAKNPPTRKDWTTRTRLMKICRDLPLHECSELQAKSSLKIQDV
uniref:RXLR phytopathogen effector protein WY-domain domain-containing protein n=1 Tax=Hyaloperonospora arabidopsidis (strain Emoy2) TaxID=559515 RepID=M4C605_HYAAE